MDRLHKKLENYRLPKDVDKQVGKSRLERVFRDDADIGIIQLWDGVTYNYDSNTLELIKIIHAMEGQLSGLDKESGSPVVTSWTDEEEKRFLVKPVTYEEIIRLADKLIGGYEPDERVREKYSPGKT